MTTTQNTLSSDLILAPAATYVADGTGVAHELKRNIIYNVVCKFTDKKTDVTDLMDVFVDVLVGTIWINVIHFTQAKGDGTDSQIECATVGPMVTDTAVIVATSDLASGAVRGGVFGSQMRARWDFTDGGGGGAASFDFSVVAYGI